MLAKLGYDPDANPPNYGVPDGLVANNTKEVSSTANQIMTKSDWFRCMHMGKSGKFEVSS